MVKLTAADYRERASDMRRLAEKSVDPGFRRSCEDLADGWALLALQEDALERAREAAEARTDQPVKSPRGSRA